MSKVESSSRALYCAALIGMLLVVSTESYAQNRARQQRREATYSKPQSSGYANYGANGYDYDEGLGRPTKSSRITPAATAYFTTVPVNPAQSREEIYREERGGAFDERRNTSLIQGALKSDAGPGLSKNGIAQYETIKRMRVASSFDGDMLEHIFPGKFQVEDAHGDYRTLTGYRDRLDFLLDEL